MKQKTVYFEMCHRFSEKGHVVFKTDLDTSEITDYATAEKIIVSALYTADIPFDEITKIYKNDKTAQGKDMRLQKAASRWNFVISAEPVYECFEVDCTYEVTLEDYLECSQKLSNALSELDEAVYQNENFMNILQKMDMEQVCSVCSFTSSYCKEAGNCTLGIPFDRLKNE